MTNSKDCLYNDQVEGEQVEGLGIGVVVRMVHSIDCLHSEQPEGMKAGGL